MLFRSTIAALAKDREPRAKTWRHGWPASSRRRAAYAAIVFKPLSSGGRPDGSKWFKSLERAAGIEPATFSLGSWWPGDFGTFHPTSGSAALPFHIRLAVLRSFQG